MSANTHLLTRVSSETKQRFTALARHQGLSESALLARMVDASLVSVGAAPPPVEAVEPVAASGRISVRLLPDDLLWVRERAVSRSLPTSTYISLLVRAHLRSLAPLPNEELAAPKRSVAELGAIGRNLNQIARHLNQGGGVGPTQADLHALLRACTGLRDHVKSLINTNLASWQAGYEKTPR